jgi:hypothetical protein
MDIRGYLNIRWVWIWSDIHAHGYFHGRGKVRLMGLDLDLVLQYTFNSASFPSLSITKISVLLFLSRLGNSLGLSRILNH